MVKAYAIKGSLCLRKSGGGVLCISPLKQLMQEQVHKPRESANVEVDSAIKAGIKAVYINEDSIKANPNIWKKVEDAQYQLVYVCPESWLKEDSYFWNHLSRRPNKFMSSLIAVAIDEAHCIWAYWWFRVDYRAIGRCDCMPGIPFRLYLLRSRQTSAPTSQSRCDWKTHSTSLRVFAGATYASSFRKLLHYTTIRR